MIGNRVFSRSMENVLLKLLVQISDRQDLVESKGINLRSFSDALLAKQRDFYQSKLLYDFTVNKSNTNFVPGIKFWSDLNKLAKKKYIVREGKLHVSITLAGVHHSTFIKVKNKCLHDWILSF